MNSLRRLIFSFVCLSLSFKIKAFQLSLGDSSYGRYVRDNGFQQSKGKLKREDCYFGDGSTYRGVMESAENGQLCIDWADIDGFISKYQTMGLEDGPYCRNPDGEIRPWCYVDRQRHWSYCSIANCRPETNSSDISVLHGNNEYRFGQPVRVELVDGPNKYSGRVEIITENTRGTVCDDSWDDNDASVICRMLGHRSGKARIQAHFGKGNSSILLDDVQCYGIEASIMSCRHSGVGVHDCEHNEDAGVICSPTSGLPVRVELVDGPNKYSGRVEITIGSTRGTVCDDLWDDNDASVICRMLGHRSGKARIKAHFGRGNSSILLDDVRCYGTEASIMSCRHAGVGDHNCMHTEDAGVICSPKNESESCCGVDMFECDGGDCHPKMLLCDFFPDCIDGYDEAFETCVNNIPELRIELVNGPNNQSGRVEIVIGTERGTVCDDEWDDTDAKVICNILGYDRGKALNRAHFGQGSSSIILDDVHCDGTEASIMSCRHSGVGVHDCEHNEDAGVICSSEKCGIRPLQHNSRKKRLIESRIISGSEAEKGFYPWQAGVRKLKRSWISTHKVYDHLCGGTILNDRWILSAAHCFDNTNKDEIRVHTGDHDLSKDDEFEEHFELEYLIQHPNYTYPSFDYDIALIKMKLNKESGIQFNNEVQPACLPVASLHYETGLTCHISGWGKTSVNDRRGQTVLRAAEVRLIDDVDCRRQYKDNFTLNMVCAGYMEGGIDACQGDSGGPLVCSVDGLYYVMGVISFGRGCAQPEYPGVYAKVAALQPWIEETMASYP